MAPTSGSKLPRNDPAGVQGELFEGSAALDPFFQHLPDKPYCADDPRHGLRVLPRSAALRRPTIQHQPPWLRVHLTFDIDRDGAWCAADEAGLPVPTWTAINRQNGHGHAVYSLDAPVLLGPRDRDGPIRYLVQVERALRVRLGADASYGGFTTKNPVHRHWVTIAGGGLYELDELRDYLGDLRKYATAEPEAAGIGRNVEAFDAVRLLSYRTIRQFWRPDGFEAWAAYLLGEVRAYTGERHDPALHDQECRWIAGSIARWIWRRFTPAGFRAIQRRKGVKGGAASGVARREAIADRDRAIVADRAAGMTLRAIAEVYGLSEGGVRLALKRNA